MGSLFHPHTWHMLLIMTEIAMQTFLPQKKMPSEVLQMMIAIGFDVDESYIQQMFIKFDKNKMTSRWVVVKVDAHKKF